MKKNNAQLFTLALVAGLANASYAANEPIVSADWFPMVDGAVLIYQSTTNISSTAAQVNIKAGQSFAGQSNVYEWTMTAACDKLTGNGRETLNVSGGGIGQCYAEYRRYFVPTGNGLLTLGDRRKTVEYGFAVNNQPYVRESIYDQPAQTYVLKDGYVPGDYVYQAPIPMIAPGGWVLSGIGSGIAWGATTSTTSTYSTTAYAARSGSAFENFRDVGIYASFVVPAATLRTLYVDDHILDLGGAWNPGHLRYQGWQYAKGVGPVMIRSGDQVFPVANFPGYTPNTYYTNTDVMTESYVLTKHNLVGCPGYDSSLPALPQNSGNICQKIYGSNPSASAKSMVEYWHSALDYYFMTSRGTEQALLDDPQYGFARTGKSFLVAGAPVNGLAPFTRFYFDKVAKNQTRGSHFYTNIASEVTSLTALNPSNAQLAAKPYNEGIDSYAYAPIGTGAAATCPANTLPVYRVFRGNSRFPDNPNHRFTTDKAVYDQFVAAGWDGENIVACALPPAQ